MNIYETIKNFKATRSEIFSIYNKMRSLVRSGIFEAGRLNRALGLMISQSITGSHVGDEYVATRSTCTCPDSTYRHSKCKHMIAVNMLYSIHTARQSNQGAQA